MNPKVSVIIPAYNEEKDIKKSVELIKSQKYQPLEVIVVVNNTKDRTFEIAKTCADKVLNFPGKIGVSAARNEGARIAQGDVFIFSDADSYISQGGLEKVARITDEKTIGTLFGQASDGGFNGKLFFLLKNFIHKIRLYHGVIDGVFFCHRNIFFETNGFDKEKKIAEFKDFIKRARAKGAKYRIPSGCRAITSMRRYEEKGYLNLLFFWLKWEIYYLFKKEGKESEKYFGADDIAKK